MRLLIILALFTQLRVLAVTEAPVLLRACLKNSDSTLTLSWTAISDGCGSFNKYVIYGNKTGSAFSKVAEITDISVTEHSFKLNDLNSNRKYYITVLYLCDMQDSVLSNEVSIDVEMKKNTVLDSLSFDINTQEIIAGWRSNDEPDLMGYRIFKYSGGISDSLGETSDTSFTVSTGIGDVFDVTIAAFDSCNNYSKISSSHRPTILNAQIDTCANEVSLNWSLYKGWSNIDSQSLFVRLNNGDFQHFMSLSGAQNTFTYNNFQLGDTICFLIRSYTAEGSISSSSNIRCIETRAPYIPSYTYLSKVTVDNNVSIDLGWEISGVQDISGFNLYRSDNGSSFALLDYVDISNTNTTYTYNDNNVDVQNQSYTYLVAAVNLCDQEVDTSNQSRSILLKLDKNLSYNSYINWDGGVNYYNIEYRAFNSSTWNLFQTQNNPSETAVGDSAYCYRIVAQENNNSYGYSETSTSNEVCIEPSLKVFMPNTMVLNGKNNRFVVIGEGIDHNNSYFEIYNRWGEMLVQYNTDQAWYGEYMGKKVMPGVYVYVVKVRGIKGESTSYNGVLRIIE